jgi:hypothetical protein
MPERAPELLGGVPHQQRRAAGRVGSRPDNIWAVGWATATQGRSRLDRVRLGTSATLRKVFGCGSADVWASAKTGDRPLDGKKCRPATRNGPAARCAVVLRPRDAWAVGMTGRRGPPPRNRCAGTGPGGSAVSSAGWGYLNDVWGTAAERRLRRRTRRILPGTGRRGRSPSPATPPSLSLAIWGSAADDVGRWQLRQGRALRRDDVVVGRHRYYATISTRSPETPPATSGRSIGAAAGAGMATRGRRSSTGASTRAPGCGWAVRDPWGRDGPGSSPRPLLAAEGCRPPEAEASGTAAHPFGVSLRGPPPGSDSPRAQCSRVRPVRLNDERCVGDGAPRPPPPPRGPRLVARPRTRRGAMSEDVDLSMARRDRPRQLLGRASGGLAARRNIYPAGLREGRPGGGEPAVDPGAPAT